MFSARLKQFRKTAGLNQAQMARILAVSQTQVSNYENGNDGPSIDKLTTIADYFGVSIDYLVGRSDDPRCDEFLTKKEQALLATLPELFLPAYQAAKEKNPENLQQIIDTFTRMAKDYYSLAK